MSRWAYSELTFSNSSTFTNHMELHQTWFSACQSAEGGNCPLNFPALPVDEFGVIRLNVNAITLKGLNMQIRSNLIPSLASFWHIWTGMKHWHCYWYPDDPDLISIQNLLELIDQLVWEFFLIRLKVIKLQLAQSNYACFSILGTKKKTTEVWVGIWGKSNLLQSSNLKIICGPFCGCGHQYELWHAASAAGMRSQWMIGCTPAAENTQASNRKQESLIKTNNISHHWNNNSLALTLKVH